MGGQPERTGAFVQQYIELSFLVANSQAVGCSCLQDISTALEKEIVACLFRPNFSFCSLQLHYIQAWRL